MIPKTPFHYELWINGKEIPSGSGKRFERQSPAHGVVVGDYAEAGIADVDAAVQAAGKPLIADPGRSLPALFA
jgi:acyl-CoA reductase-like NAD-dependent aldehyde dehydrogenase